MESDSVMLNLAHKYSGDDDKWSHLLGVPILLHDVNGAPMEAIRILYRAKDIEIHGEDV